MLSNAEPQNLILIQQDIDRAHDFGRLPVLRADDLACQAAFAIDQVGFGIHGGAVIGGSFFRRIAVGGKDHVIVLQKFFVRVVVFVHADAQNHSAFGTDGLLQSVERLRFFQARRAPGRPEIQDHDFAAQVRQMRGAGDFQIKILGFASRQARFALTIAGSRKRRTALPQRRSARSDLESYVSMMFSPDISIIHSWPRLARAELPPIHAKMNASIP